MVIEDHSKEAPFQWKPERVEASYGTMWTTNVQAERSARAKVLTSEQAWHTLGTR